MSLSPKKDKKNLLIKRSSALSLFFILAGCMVFIFFRFFFTPHSSQEAKHTLRVMSYSSFVGVFGPGSAIQAEFEKICSCRIKWIKVSDSTLFAQRLSLRKDGFKTDVVLGLDQLSLRTAQKLPWKKIIKEKTKISKKFFTSPSRQFLSDTFVPYNWSPMGFITSQKKMAKEGAENISSLKDLLKPEFKHKISLPSPFSSTVGLQFYYWIWFVFREASENFLKSLKSQLYGLPPSWSTSYALFQRGHVSLSFSYLSSLLYHREQNQPNFYFLSFQEGHPFQVELAGVSGFCLECELAQDFISFLLTPKVQHILQKKNYMFPVIYDTKVEGEEGVEALLRSPQGPFAGSKLISYQDWDLFLEQKEEWLNKWKRHIQ